MRNWHLPVVGVEGVVSSSRSESLSGVGHSQQRAMPHEEGTQVSASGALAVKGVLDRTLVVGDPVGNRNRDRPQVAGELLSGHEALAIPVRIESVEIDGVLDERGVDLQEQGTTDVVDPQNVCGVAREEQDRVQVFEIARSDLHVEALLGAFKRLFELQEDLLARGTGRCHDVLLRIFVDAEYDNDRKGTQTKPLRQDTQIANTSRLDRTGFWLCLRGGNEIHKNDRLF